MSFFRSPTFAALAFLVYLSPSLAGGEEADPALTAKWLYSHDSDEFDEYRISAGYEYANGFGVSANAAHYSAPGWSATGRGVAATYAQRNASRNLEATLGVTRTKDHQALAGSLDYIEHLTKDTGLGFSLERDVVDSVQSIDQGIHYTALMLVAEHDFTPRFSVGAAAGQTWFSDHNRRPILRTRWNYELIQDSGFSTYLKTRHYKNSHAYQGNYYAPEKLGEASIGLFWRTALGDQMVFFAGGDAGRQRTEDNHQSIWSLQAGLQAPRRAPVQWRVALEKSNYTSSLSNQPDESYRYFSLTGYLLFPLR
ncbi:MAG: hypothetical protein LBU53_13615 [Zoogloeaceae bacterium]|jgi:hypothetical protein|nr:hypothetical protein [Zoogloeaceae bacterium]